MRKNVDGPITRSLVNHDQLIADLAERKNRRNLGFDFEHEGDIVRVTSANGISFVVDANDWPMLAKYRFTIAADGVAVLGGADFAATALARFILSPAETEWVDHRDGDRHNNRRANLRICSPTENARNMALNRSSSTGFKGVSTVGAKYRAYAFLSGKQRHLGVHATPEDAARAYDDFAREHFGDFACVNFPRAGEQSVHRRSADK